MSFRNGWSKFLNHKKIADELCLAEICVSRVFVFRWAEGIQLATFVIKH